MLLFSVFLGLTGCIYPRIVKDKVPVLEKKMSKEEVTTEWHDYLYSKGVHQSLCVEGLLHRLESFECSKVDVQKFEDRVRIVCIPKQDDERITYWENHVFEVMPPVLIKNNLDKINIHRIPSICIDTKQKVTAYPLEAPMLERIKVKKD